MERKVFKIVEKKGQVFGLPLLDLGITFLYFIVFTMGIVVVGFFVPVSGKYFLADLASTILLIIVLKYLNKKKHPSFLLSFISFKYLQLKQLNFKEPLNAKSKKKKFDRI